MTAVTVSNTNIGWIGEIKKMTLELSSAAAAQTYDTDMDATDGRAAEFEEIHSAWVQDPDEGMTPCAFSNSTGIITLPTGVPDTVYLMIEGK